MDNKEVAEVLSYFRANVSDLKVLGKQWGLSDDDISTCIENAMAADVEQIAPASNKTRMKFAARSVWLRMKMRWRCTFFMQLSGVFAVLLVAGAIAMKNDEVHRRVFQIIDPLLYPLLWSTRLITLPFHDIINAYDYYMEECLVDNPLFTGGQNSPEICEMCQNLKTVNVFQSSFSGNLTEVGLTNACVFQGKGEVVSLENLQQVLSSSPVRRPIPGIKTNLAWPTQVVHLIDERLQGVLAQSPFFYFLWVSKQPSTSQLMRKLFPNPNIFGQNAKTPLKKSVFLEGSKSRVNPLSANLQWPFSWYVQGWGFRKAVLTPISSCLDTCQRLDITLQKGDLLTYSSHLYKVEMHPVGDNISISFLSYFDTV